MDVIDVEPGTGHPEIVVVDDVSKHFIMRRDNSLKERVVTFGRQGRIHREKFDSLKNVSFSIPAGTSIGLMGPNGSGKSTLLKIIGGIIDPSSGSVRRRGRMAALLELGAGFHPDLSGRDNVYLNASILGLSKAETDAQFDSIVAFAEIGDFIDTQVKFYSSGMYVRLAFAVAVHTDPDLLLVDEVLAVGDEAFQRKCMDKIRQFQNEGRTIILVSHSASQVMEVCDRGVVLHDGELVFVGSAADATKAHREVLEGKRRETVEAAAEAAAEAGAKDPVERDVPRIVGLTLADVDGRAVETAHPGQDLHLTIRVDHPTDSGPWNSSISIDTSQGQQVFGTGTRRLEQPHSSVAAGEHSITYVLKAPAFAGGQYFVNAEVSDADGAPWDVMWQGVSFFIPLEFRQTGTVFAEATVDVS
ncbi:ABC transporter ATP-binding protein [Microbacterium sp. NE2HP2]|uniref:ABC transporter ATP-binding protein n=1 Tax=Microbacterium plantarum TaxID=1816425 RepID=UPI0023658B06|nr:ABC transporter ATP-binding protein [Microbacterium plantarum]MDD7945090.1 ABC transporter ATP-binding protein [Microbacterium plantarum]